ncbi:MAG: permease [Pseudonocardia sp.]
MLSFVCSIGSVPLAVVLWTGGISFGGVVAFIFADLIILPILNIYRRYSGTRMAILLATSFYATAAFAGYAVELLFSGLGWIPDRTGAHMPDEAISWNYTTWLNIAFLALAAALVVRFLRSGGRSMLAMMGGDPEHGESGHSGHTTHH